MPFVTDFVSFEEEVVNPAEKLSYFYLHDKISGKDYRPTYPNGIIDLDYGIIMKLPNPFSVSHQVIMFAGCDSHGVLASVRAISFDPDTKPILKQIHRNIKGLTGEKEKYYFCVIRCQAVGHDVGRLAVEEVHLLNGKISWAN